MTPTEIKALRKQLGLSQSEMGRLLGLKPENAGNTVRRWEMDRSIKSHRTPSGPVVVAMTLIKWFLAHNKRLPL